MRDIGSTHVFLAGVLFACCLLPLSVASLADDPDGPSAEFYLAGMENAAVSVASGRGDVKVVDWMLKNDGGVLKIETVHRVVWQGSLFRETATKTYLINDPGDAPTELLVTPGTAIVEESAYDGTLVTVYDPGRGEAKVGSPTSSFTHSAYASYVADASMRGHGLALPNSARGAVPSFVQNSTGFHVVGTETIDGDECAMLENISTFAAPPGGGDAIINTHRMWVNPTKGFTVPRVRDWAEGGSIGQKTLMYEVDVQMRLYGDTLWGPAGFTRTQYKTDPATGGRTKSLETVVAFDPGYEVNPTVSPGELALQLPSGTNVYNEILDAEYTVP